MATEPVEFFIEQLRRVIAALGWSVTATQITESQVIVTVTHKIG